MSNYAFIDGQNLFSGVKSLGWQLDLAAFRTHLRQRYHVSRAFYFVGYMESNRSLYTLLQSVGYELVFKEVVQGQGHSPKGNVDAHLVLWVMKEMNRFDRAVLVTGDGDFYPLVDHLFAVDKLGAVMAPNRAFCSRLLRRSAKGSLRYVEDIRTLVERSR